ncbi:hypothetical protein Zm00014a_030002, partial [Zea mays]
QSAAAINHRRPSLFPRRRWSSAVPFATVSSAPTSATWDAPQFPLPLPISLCPRSPAVLRAAAGVRHRRPGPSSRHCRHRGVPGARLEVRKPPCPLPSPLLLSAALNSSSELINAAAEPLCRGPPPSGAPAPTQSPPDDSPRPPQPSRPLRSPQGPAERPRPSSPASPPPRGQAPPSLLAVGKAKAGHPTPAVHPRSDDPDSISPGPILAVRRRSNDPGPLPPHPAPLCLLAPPVSPPAPALPAGPACQPARARSACWPRLSACPRLRCPPGPACQPLRPPRARAPARGSNPARWSEIRRLLEPDTPSPARFLKETPGFLKFKPAVPGFLQLGPRTFYLIQNKYLEYIFNP